MKVRANAKINLSLDVSHKRADSYHEVCMILQEIDLCDELEVELTQDGEIFLECLSEDMPNASDNIAYKAAELFFKETNIKNGCKIKLCKKIPVMAGLGGGSSDGAAVLKALNELTQKPLTNEKLKQIALNLGADVPFFIEGKTQLAQGIGEKLTPLGNTLDFFAVIIKPEINVSTKKAYEIIDSVSFPHPDVKKACKYWEENDKENFFSVCANVFEYTLGKDREKIDEIKNYLTQKGSRLSLMSGSGPTVFGLFESLEEAQKALLQYKGKCFFKQIARLIN